MVNIGFIRFLGLAIISLYVVKEWGVKAILNLNREQVNKEYIAIANIVTAIYMK